MTSLIGVPNYSSVTILGDGRLLTHQITERTIRDLLVASLWVGTEHPELLIPTLVTRIILFTNVLHSYAWDGDYFQILT